MDTHNDFIIKEQPLNPQKLLDIQDSPMALGGQRTAAVSPAGVIFHTTLEKLSSPHISWGSAHKQKVRKLYSQWEKTPNKKTKQKTGVQASVPDEILLTQRAVFPSTDLGISSHYIAGPLLVLQDRIALQKRVHNKSCFSAGSPRHRF